MTEFQSSIAVVAVGRDGPLALQPSQVTHHSSTSMPMQETRVDPQYGHEVIDGVSMTGDLITGNDMAVFRAVIEIHWLFIHRNCSENYLYLPEKLQALLGESLNPLL